MSYRSILLHSLQSHLNVAISQRNIQRYWRNGWLSSPLLGRNARLYKDGVVIGYGKNISVKASAELIKEYSMDALTLTRSVREGARFFFNLGGDIV
jgi:hypothetical protein